MSRDAARMNGGALETLKAVNFDVTREALEKNVNEDLQKVAKEESAKQLADWEASQKRAMVEDEDDEFDDMDDDPVLAQLQQKRIEEMKSKCARLPGKQPLAAALHGSSPQAASRVLARMVTHTGRRSRGSSTRRGTGNIGRLLRRSFSRRCAAVRTSSSTSTTPSFSDARLLTST